MKISILTNFAEPASTAKALQKELHSTVRLGEIHGMANTEPIIFEPLAMERIWGGRRLENLFRKNPAARCADRRILGGSGPRGRAERRAQRTVARNHTCTSFGRPGVEKSLESVYESHAAARFPILIKLLDARERLSVQVHPPVHVSEALGGEPKTEMWYFADAQPGANIYVGLKRGVTREQFETLLREGRVEEALHVIPVRKRRQHLHSQRTAPRHRSRQCDR